MRKAVVAPNARGLRGTRCSNTDTLEEEQDMHPASVPWVAAFIVVDTGLCLGVLYLLVKLLLPW